MPEDWQMPSETLARAADNARDAFDSFDVMGPPVRWQDVARAVIETIIADMPDGPAKAWLRDEVL